MNRKILIVGMADSIHLARWLEQFRDSGLEFKIISSSPHRKVHEKIRQLISESGGPHQSHYSMPWISRHLSLPMWILDRFLDDLLRGLLILVVARHFLPNFIHVNELQNAGYATLKAFKLSKGDRFPKVFSTNYGSELVWFRKYPSHAKRLRQLLEISDSFSAECQRDYGLARELGFGGLNMPLMPVAGGGRFNVPGDVARKTIAIKGYQNHWGRALTVLDVIEAQAEQLHGYKIEVFSCNTSVVRRVKAIRNRSTLDIEYHRKGSLTHQQMMELFSRSVAYVGFSMSDGISTSMIEAMANGAIPIQTCTSCADEWVESGKSGFILAPEDRPGLSNALGAIVNGSFNVDHARSLNYKVVSRQYDPDNLKATAKAQYAKMLAL
jgi:hypothetical protein